MPKGALSNDAVDSDAFDETLEIESVPTLMEHMHSTMLMSKLTAYQKIIAIAFAPVHVCLLLAVWINYMYDPSADVRAAQDMVDSYSFMDTICLSAVSTVCLLALWCSIFFSQRATALGYLEKKKLKSRWVMNTVHDGEEIRFYKND